MQPCSPTVYLIWGFDLFVHGTSFMSNFKIVCDELLMN